jgi:hypothetical protein
MTKQNKSNNVTFKTLNIFNYFTTWIAIWFVLYLTKIFKYNPIIAYIFILYPTMYMLYIYVKNNKDNFTKRFIIIFFSIMTHYIPLIYLYMKYEIEFKIELIFIYLILMNLYLCYLKINKLNVNVIYTNIYFNNELI